MEERTYWTDELTLHERIEQARKLQADLERRGVSCAVGVVDCGYGIMYLISLDLYYEHEKNEHVMQFSYSELESATKTSGADIPLTACRIEIG